MPTSLCMVQRAQVLRAYRELVALCRSLTPAKREATLVEVRSAVRANAAERDQGVASDQLKALWARVSFLRVVRARVEGARVAREPRLSGSCFRRRLAASATAREAAARSSCATES